MVIETQVIPVVTVIGVSEVINKRTFLAAFASNLCTATLYPQQKNSVGGGGKISFFSMLLDDLISYNDVEHYNCVAHF